MARKTVTTIEEESPPETGPLEGVAYSFVDDDDGTNAESALEGLLNEFSGSGDAIVNVYRQIDGANNIAFLFKTTPTEMRGGEIMEKLRDAYGSGDYRIHVREKNLIVGNKGFSIEAPKEAEKVEAKDNTSDMMAMMMNQANNQQALLLAAVNAFASKEAPPPPPAIDPVAMQAGMINALVALKGLAVDDKPVGKDPVEMLIQGITLAKELGPKEGETNSNDLVLEGLKAFAPTIVGATQAGMAQMAGNAPPGAPPGAPGAPPQQLPGPPPATPENREVFEKQLMKVQLGFLVRNAMEGRNPELYAELVLDQIGAEKVLEFIGAPDAMDKLIALVPEIETVRPWFDRLRVCIMELTAPENDAQNESDAGEFIPGTPINGGVIIPPAPDAIPSTTIEGDTSGAPTGGNGDTQDP